MWASAALSLWLVPAALAHVPILEPARRSDQPPSLGASAAGEAEPFPGAVPLRDPTRQSLAVYGYLFASERFDVYTFTVSQSATIPIEILVPTTGGSPAFRPSFAVIARAGPPGSGGLPEGDGLPSDLERRLRGITEAGFDVLVVPDPGAAERPTFFEPFSVERYYRGGRAEVSVRAGGDYYVLVFVPTDASVRSGPYTLGLGSSESFTAADWAWSSWAIVRIKLGLYGGGPLSWAGLAQLAAIVAVIVGIVVFVVIRRRRRRRRAQGGTSSPSQAGFSGG